MFYCTLQKGSKSLDKKRVQYNPGSHWSSVLSWFELIHYENRRDILNINRDDASGFRFDTMTTYVTTTVQGCDVNTRTDYVNKHPSVLQTTSYNFTGTHNCRSLCWHC
jgi:hypothetical protein